MRRSTSLYLLSELAPSRGEAEFFLQSSAISALPEVG